MTDVVSPGPFDSDKLIDSFNAAARGYDEVAVLQKHVGEELLDRLKLMKLGPALILDLGSGPGNFARQLAHKYPGARVLQLDVAENMLRHSRKRDSWFFSRQMYVCADAEQLPLTQGSVDMAYSNLMLQWCQDPRRLFASLAGTLKPGAMFIFSSLGPDTLRELRASWSEADDLPHVNPFVDMHDLGDGLIQAGFADPVLETDYLTLTYTDVNALMHDLKRLGAHNVHSHRRKSLTGKNRFDRMRQSYERLREQGRLPATYEIVYGHAWRPAESVALQRSARETAIPVESLRQSLKKTRVPRA